MLGCVAEGTLADSSGELVMQLWSKHVRFNSLLIVLAGAILIYWGLVFPRTDHFVAPLLSYRFIAHHIFGFGALIFFYGLFTLVRHKGEFDDFERPDEDVEDDLQKGSRDGG